LLFIPPESEATAGDVRFVGIMGMLAIVGYAVGFWGSLTFTNLSLYAFQSGGPQARPGSYYKGRFGFYC
jgi:hypothetical protein